MDQNGMQIEDNVLTEYHGTEKEVVVPAGVKVIRERVFRFNLSVERVVLPDTVEIIREEAFQYSTLQSIRIPPQVRELPERAPRDWNASGAGASPGAKASGPSGFRTASRSWKRKSSSPPAWNPSGSRHA